MNPTPTPTTAHKPTLNGTLKRHQIRHPQPPPPSPQSLYRECLKNHAASLGGHALDGCGEFMPSPSSTPSDPTSLTCAACGCHRNFHRRLLPPHFNDEDNDEREEDNDNDEHFAGSQNDGDDEVSRRQHSTSPPPPSATHMLLALSTGLSSAGASGVAVAPARKRFRSKFSPEQKERMQELSERLGWRLQKRDEGLVEERCREIGVGKGVFKVWMHNNKHNFNKQHQRSSPTTPTPVISGSDNNINNNNNNNNNAMRSTSS